MVATGAAAPSRHVTVLVAIALGVAVSALTLALLARGESMPAPSADVLTRLVSRRSRVRPARALEVLRSTEGALRSGVPIATALRLATDGPAPSDDPFVRAVQVFELNTPLDAAIRGLAEGSKDRGVRLALQAVAIVASQELPPTRAAIIVGGIADRIAFEARLAEEIASRTSGLRAQIVMLALLVPALAAYLAATVPGLLDVLSSPLGRFVLIPAATMLELAGILASRAIVRRVT